MARTPYINGNTLNKCLYAGRDRWDLTHHTAQYCRHTRRTLGVAQTRPLGPVHRILMRKYPVEMVGTEGLEPATYAM